jgi:hypothetical protein
MKTLADSPMRSYRMEMFRLHIVEVQLARRNEDDEALLPAGVPSISFAVAVAM